jgi:hypothetical protein
MTQKWYAVRGLEALAPNAIYTVYEGEPVDTARYAALLADVDRLTGDNAALSEALDTALAHLKESEADRDTAVAELATVRAQLAQADDYGMYCYDYGADGNTWRMSFDEWLTKRNEPVR